MDKAKDFLESLSPIEYLIIIERIYERYLKAIETILPFFHCGKCGECCRICPISVTLKEVETISHILKMEPPKFINAFCEVERGMFRIKAPCPLLSENKCSIYEHRPKVCRLYPFNLNVMGIYVNKECSLGQEIVSYIESVEKEVWGEKKEEIFKIYQSDPLDSAIGTLLELLAKNQPHEALVNEYKEAVSGLLNPENLREEKLDTTVFIPHLILLEFVADKLKASGEKWRHL